MAMICIGEINLDRLLFPTKIIYTRFFVDPRYPLKWRVLAVLVIVGAPTVVGVWLLVHVRALWRAGLQGLREAWGQTATAGLALFVLVRDLRAPDRSPPVAAAALLRGGCSSSSPRSTSSSDLPPGNGLS